MTQQASQSKRRLGLLAGLIVAASLASCAVVPGPYGFPHIIDLTVSGGGHGSHSRGHQWRRGHHGGHHGHGRRHRRGGHGGHRRGH